MNKEMMNNIAYYTNENKVTFTKEEYEKIINAGFSEHAINEMTQSQKEIVLKDYKEPYCENINGQKYCYQENEKS